MSSTKSGSGVRSRPDEDLYLGAREAAEALGVTVQTLYTYVSRKNIRAHRTAGARESRYLRSDIEHVRNGLPSSARYDATPGLANASSITLVTESGSFYRGRSTLELSNSASLEDVAKLLWDTGEYDPFAHKVECLPRNWDALLKVMRPYNTPDRIAMLMPVIEAANPRAYDLSTPGFLRSGTDILRWCTALMIGQSRPSVELTHRYIGRKTKCGARLEDIIRRLLVLAADQAFEPATYAVRATANTGATPYWCVMSGFAAATGKRRASARIISFSRFIGEIDASQDPTEPVRSRIREGQELPGFGYSPFPFSPDPRAIAMWSALQDALAKDEGFRRFNAALQLGVELSGQHPDFAFLAAYVARRIGCDPHASLIRIGRLVGWIAHALEQQNDRPLLRWRVKYTGPLPFADAA